LNDRNASLRAIARTHRAPTRALRANSAPLATTPIRIGEITLFVGESPMVERFE
jgi:hypothetical protein